MSTRRNMIKPHRLQDGDKIGLVTFSAPEAAENSERVERGVERLAELGFRVHFARNALSHNKAYLAESAQLLAQDLNEMFEDESIAGIICTGGGTNANSLLPHINYELIRRNPKVLVGLSNPTVVLNAVTARSNVITFSGPVLVWNFGDDSLSPYVTDSFTKAVMSSDTIGPLPESGNWRFLQDGQATGPLYGGNLWSIQSLLGTAFEPDWNGAILFWEDIAKEPKRLDAMLTHFKLAGVFDKIAGMIIGELVLCESKVPSLSIEEIVLNLVDEYNFPVLSGVRLGHTDEKLTLPIGAVASIDSSGEPKFRVVENAVL